MRRLRYELIESVRIAFAQIRANRMRSALTALGVVIGIVAVTLMGTAIKGIDAGVDRSLAGFGDDILYVTKWPLGNVKNIVAEAGEAAVHAGVNALDRGAHEGDRHDADDHAERGERGAHAVGANLREGDADRLDKLVTKAAHGAKFIPARRSRSGRRADG